MCQLEEQLIMRPRCLAIHIVKPDNIPWGWATGHVGSTAFTASQAKPLQVRPHIASYLGCASLVIEQCNMGPWCMDQCFGLISIVCGSARWWPGSLPRLGLVFSIVNALVLAGCMPERWCLQMLLLSIKNDEVFALYKNCEKYSWPGSSLFWNYKTIVQVAVGYICQVRRYLNMFKKRSSCR